ncbi:hypothetical protein [Spiroplasma endosymbiont of Tricholauxania praeusta]|uniref:hypothetical protein n=1 Tax=Spiroplasma endosymbiont of Tricholauxania praeusta TaxID=3066296 RepID=UPI0030CB8F0F
MILWKILLIVPILITIITLIIILIFIIKELKNEYKEKLLEHIKNINFKGIFGLLIEKIENGEFDNE